MAEAAEVKERVKKVKSEQKLLGLMPNEWSLKDAKELVETIRTTVLNFGYLIGLGGDLLSSAPSNVLQLVLTPGTPVQIAEAVAPTQKNQFIYVNAPNEERLLKWFDKMWGSGAVEDDPVVSFGQKKAMNNGGAIPRHIGKDKNNNYVYVNDVKKLTNKADVMPSYTLGKRVIELNFLPMPPASAFASKGY